MRALASDGPVRPFLLGRDREGLVRSATALEQAGVVGEASSTMSSKPATSTSHEDAIARAFDRAGGFDVVVLAIGVLGAQAGLDARRDEALEVMSVGFLGSGSLLLAFLRRLREQGHGTLVVLSSVAVERAARLKRDLRSRRRRASTRSRRGWPTDWAGSGVRVLVVRPGFVQDADDRRTQATAVCDHSRAGGGCDEAGSESGRPHHLGAGGPTLCVRRASPSATRGVPEDAVVRRNPLLVDVAIAVALTILVLIVVPGVAVVAIVAVVVVLACGASLVVAALRRRRARPPRSRLPTPSRPPRRPMPRR